MALSLSRFEWREPPPVKADRVKTASRNVPKPVVPGTPTTATQGQYIVLNLEGVKAGQYEAMDAADFHEKYAPAESASFGKKEQS